VIPVRNVFGLVFKRGAEGQVDSAWRANEGLSNIQVAQAATPNRRQVGRILCHLVQPHGGRS
jgi:hypothetical protein